VKNSYGLDTTHESILILHIVTDGDGNLKIKQIEGFQDSKGFVALMQSIGTVMAAAHANK